VMHLPVKEGDEWEIVSQPLTLRGWELRHGLPDESACRGGVANYV